MEFFGDENFENRVLSLIESKNKGMHKTLDGKFVKVGTRECGRDIQSRIDDIKHHRDASPHRSDARIYYTGLLRVLGRQLRENDRVMASSKPQNKKEISSKGKKLTEALQTRSEEESSRLLTLAGII